MTFLMILQRLLTDNTDAERLAVQFIAAHGVQQVVGKASFLEHRREKNWLFKRSRKRPGARTFSTRAAEI